jgi:hypothetical protein
MKIFKIVILRAEDGEILMCDAVQYEGKLWLVPEWTAFPANTKASPNNILGWFDARPGRAAVSGRFCSTKPNDQRRPSGPRNNSQPGRDRGARPERTIAARGIELIMAN